MTFGHNSNGYGAFPVVGHVADLGARRWDSTASAEHRRTATVRAPTFRFEQPNPYSDFRTKRKYLFFGCESQIYYMIFCQPLGICDLPS